MEEKVRKFLETDLLERYVKGDTSSVEDLKIESYIELYTEVDSAYQDLQNNLEIIAKSNAAEAPLFILDNIKAAINSEETPVINLAEKTSNRRTPWFAIAASLVAMLFAGSSYMLYERNKSLLEENQVVVDEIFDLRNDIDQNNKILNEVMRQFDDLNDPETEKYVMRGNGRAKDLKTVAYINPVERTSMIDVVTLPQISDNEDYHIWAEMEDHFVSLGILDPSEKKMQSLPYMEDALGLSITIEPKNAKNSSGDSAVAEIELKSKNN
ncbi:anti-sigma factor [Sediminibacter sp. Hel_I_10]|uniref:anti-sigma factor n=1 Tax=Sediminibacter sp. Hel_I_10 TaxID=1392490 RepID=UPI000478C5FD|nr:anti-sigma factor [Sediminibacter sp. Hel_I_10]